MKYSKPNFEHEWSEALRYREFEKMGKDKWLEKASKDFEISNFKSIEDVLNNVDLDFDTLDDEKKERFEKSFENGDVEIPMAVKFSDNDYDLLGGNTRLAGLIKNGINPKIWVVDMTKKKVTNENEILKGGLADNKTLIQLAKKHDAKGYYHIQDMVKFLKKQLEMGMKVEMEHTDSEEKAKEIAMDHLWEDPSYYIKLKKVEAKETDASSSGSYSGPAFSSDTDVIKRPISKIPNFQPNEQELGEVTDASSSGAFDVPAFGKSTKGGRRDPLKIDGPDSIYKGRAVTDKNFPKWGGPDSVFVKVKEKCKKFPYCNQGNTGAIEIVREDKEIQEAITQISKKYGISHQQVENIVLNEIKQIFI
jgi:hypothetical protein